MKPLTTKQQEVAKAVDLTGVSAIFISREYAISPKGLDSDDLNTSVRNYADMVRFLMNRS